VAQSLNQAEYPSIAEYRNICLCEERSDEAIQWAAHEPEVPSGSIATLILILRSAAKAAHLEG
jgi:hypothetical protein